MAVSSSAILYSVIDENSQFVAAAVGAAAILATTAVYYVLSSKDKEHEFPKLRGAQFYHAWNFFQRRHDFLQSNFRRNLGKSFSFNVLDHKVIALAGEDARRVFFSHPQLSIDDGYKILVGAAPLVSDADTVTEQEDDGNVNLFNRKLNKLLNRTRLQDFLPTLLQDIIDKADKWGNFGENGRFDPFTEVNGLVLVMIARLTTCHDLTKNEADLERIGQLFMTHQASSTPTALLLPWFPSPARKAGKNAGTELFTMLYAYVETRRRAELTSDAIDIMIAEGETTKKIVGYVMAMLFVGVTNTGITSCWTLVDLAIHSEWKERCKKEIQGLISRHLDGSLPSATIYERLRTVPISAWEDELPIFDACIRESQRISLANATLRRNLGKEIKIDGQVVRRGDFLVYPMTDVHLNPEYYPEPYKYDPGRWLRPDPAPSAFYPFLGWGAGRHPCTGMKTAKLEMKLILAVFLTRYEYELVDKDGKFPNLLPVPNRNDNHQTRPLGATYYFDFRRVAR